MNRKANDIKLTQTLSSGARIAQVLMLILYFTQSDGRTSGSIGLGLMYDSNICRLSSYDIDRFKNGDKDFLLDTADDGIFKLSASLLWKSGWRGNHITIGLNTSGYLYYRNEDKNYIWSQLFLILRSGRAKLRLSSSFVPRYNSRAYIDADTDSTKWAGYWSSTNSIDIRYRVFKKNYLGVTYEFRRAWYNNYFPEYDSDRHSFGIYIQRYTPIKVKLGYKFYKSTARGYDQDGETKETSDETDISYEQDLFYTSVCSDVRAFSLNVETEIKLDVYHRVYTSQKPYYIDPLHLGRDEWRLSVEPSAKLYISPRIWAKANIEFSLRRANSEFNPEIPKLRNYDRIRAILAIGRDF